MCMTLGIKMTLIYLSCIKFRKNLIPHSLKEQYIQNQIMQFTSCSTVYLDYLDMSYPGCRSLCLSQECNRAAHILQVLGWTPLLPSGLPYFFVA